MDMTVKKDPPANRNHLIHYVAAQIDLEAHGLTTDDIGDLLDMFLQGIVQHATDFRYLQLRDFGNFEIRHRAARIHPSPVNGGPPTHIPARKVLWFTASRGGAQVVEE